MQKLLSPLHPSRVHIYRCACVRVCTRVNLAYFLTYLKCLGNVTLIDQYSYES